MQEAERCQINLITIKDGNMFLSSENSQKGVKNKAALKANNFISPATQGKNTIQLHRNVLSHRCRHLLIFYFCKREIAKIESGQNGALLSFLEKALWLGYQFSKEFKNCFPLSPATSVIEALTHFSWEKKSNLTLLVILPICQIPKSFISNAFRSTIRRNDPSSFPCERKTKSWLSVNCCSPE